MLAVWLLAAAGSAEAAPISTPSGWVGGDAAQPEARDRAEAWALAWKGTVRDVKSTRNADDFAETLALLDLTGPMPPEAMVDADGARPWVEQRVAAALGASASLDSVEVIPASAPGVSIVEARATVDGRVARLAFGPTGARHRAMVLMVPSAEEVLHTRAFDDAREALDDLRPPVLPFAHDLVRGLAMGLWLVGGVLLAVVWTRRSLPLPGARVAGRQVAGLLLGVAVLVMLVTGMGLADSAVELELSGTSPWTLAIELGLGGMAMAGLVALATELWARRLQPVASAPTDGSFSATGSTIRRHAADLTAGAARRQGPPR